MKLTGIVRGTYNTWLQNDGFVELYRRREEFANEYKQEAIQLLRRDNQLEAVLLEGKIVQKMKDELESGEYSLIRSHLAREVYSKLITDLDVVPAIQAFTWEQRLRQFFPLPANQITEGDVVDGSFTETDSEQTAEQREELPSGTD